MGAIFLPSLAATMEATGAVCPRNKVTVASTSPRVLELQGIARNQPAWNTRLARQAAKAIMLTLNDICCGLNFAFFFGQHCTAVETQVTAIASAALRFTTAVNRNGRLTDMFPLTPGSFTFIRDVTAASARTDRFKYGCSVWLAIAA